MSSAPLRKMSFEQFLEFEQAQTERHAFWRGDVFAMSGGSEAHAELQSAVILKLGPQLQKTCRVYSADQGIVIPGGNYVYSDGVIACGPQFNRGPIDTLLNPLVVFEVLSKSTEGFDRGDKFHGYARIASLRHYVLLSQYEPLVEVFSRKSETDRWTLQLFGPGETLTLEPPGIELKVDALYADIPLTPKTALP